MSKKVSITSDDEVLQFIVRLTDNRSRFINSILWKEKQHIFMKELEEAYKEQSADPEFQAEISVWNMTAGGGLNA